MNIRTAAVLVGLSFAGLLPAFGAKTCTWTGGGDGLRLGDAQNWSATPATGDTLVFTNKTTALLTLSNDLGSVASPFSAAVSFKGKGAIHLVGNPLALTSATHYFRCPVTNDVDFTFQSTGTCTFELGVTGSTSGYLVQNGKITSNESLTFVLQGKEYAAASKLSSFNGDILLPNGDLCGFAGSGGGGNSVEYIFRGRVVAKNVNYGARGVNYGAFRGIMRFYNAANAISNLYFNMKQIYTYSGRGFGPDVTIHRARTDDDFAQIFIPNGVNMTMANFGQNDQYTAVCTKNNYIMTQNTSSTDALSTLTARGTCDNTNDIVLHGRLSFVWDPIGDYTLDFRSSRESGLSGTITVKGGTLKASASGATFKNVPEIAVAKDATFEMSGGATSALTGLTRVTLEDGATFKLGASEVTPFTANKVAFLLSGSAKLDLACAVTTAVSVFTNGVPVAAGTYSSADWLTGSGSVVVADPPDYYWTGAQGSDWNTSGNWLNGVPQFSTAKAAYVWKEGATTLTVASDAPIAKHLELLNRNGKTTLNVNAGLCVSNGLLTIAKDSELKVGVGGTFKYDVAKYKNDNGTSPTFTLKDGGKITVDGGTFSIVNGNGKMSFGDSSGTVTSTLSVASGTCKIGVLSGDRSSAFQLNKGGRIEMTGGTLNYTCPYDGSSSSIKHGFDMFGGAIDLSGSSVLNYSHKAAHAFGAGTIRVRGSAQLTAGWTQAMRRYGPLNANETLDIDISENGKFTTAWNDDETILSEAAGATTRLTLRGNAAASLGNGVIVGSGAKCTGEIVLKDSASCSDSYYRFTFGTGGSASGVATGILRMSGGTLTATTSVTASYPTLRGLVFGDGASNSATGDIWNKGLCYLSGGTISVAHQLHVGDGNAYGLVEQSGGTMKMNNNSANVGNHHGTGVYRMTGGTFAGGNGTVTVGANDGTGTLEFGAGTGSFAAKNMNLAGAGATLKFVLDAEGKVIKPNVTTTLTVGTGAKLVVDSSAYQGETVSLMSFGSISGSFADSDITIVGAPKGRVKVGVGGIRFTPVVKGLMLFVR